MQRRPMLIGALLAILASIHHLRAGAHRAHRAARSTARSSRRSSGLIAIAVLLFVLNWFFHKVYWTDHIKKFNKRRRRLLSVAGGGLVSAQVLGFVLLGFSTVYREGFETVLFLQALELNSGLAVVVEGVALGAIAVAAVAVATFKLERKLPYKKMLIVTGILLTVVLAIMVGKTVRTMQGVGWVPITPDRHRAALLDRDLAGHLPHRGDRGGADRVGGLRDRQLLRCRAAQGAAARRVTARRAAQRQWRWQRAHARPAAAHAGPAAAEPVAA